jgi:hypothetical protein
LIAGFGNDLGLLRRDSFDGGATTSSRLLEPIAVAVHGQDVDVMGQPVEQYAGETLGPRIDVQSSNGRFEVTMVDPRS